jgi:hypothetical protein
MVVLRALIINYVEPQRLRALPSAKSFIVTSSCGVFCLVGEDLLRLGKTGVELLQ